VCCECWGDLSPAPKSKKQARVPANALVRVATGPPVDDMPPLTLLEAKLLAAYRPSHDIFLMKPPGRQDRPNDAYQAKWTGHVTSYPQASGEVLQAAFPSNIEEAAATMQVVFLKTTDPAQIAELVLQAPALPVGSGVHLVAYASFWSLFSRC